MLNDEKFAMSSGYGSTMIGAATSPEKKLTTRAPDIRQLRWHSIVLLTHLHLGDVARPLLLSSVCLEIYILRTNRM
jgi:hypothetical protein